MADAEVQQSSDDGERPIGHDEAPAIGDRLNQRADIASRDVSHRSVLPPRENLRVQNSLFLHPAALFHTHVLRDVVGDERGYGISRLCFGGLPFAGRVATITNLRRV
jgi:hypothetical protein